MTYKGACHCGKIAFEVEGDLKQVMQCNCSICSKKGYLLWFVPREQLKLSTPESSMGTYLFNKKAIQHRFCPVCGCSPFGEGANPATGESTAAVNVRCLEDVDISGLAIMPFDGRNMA